MFLQKINKLNILDKSCSGKIKILYCKHRSPHTTIVN